MLTTISIYFSHRDLSLYRVYLCLFIVCFLVVCVGGSGSSLFQGFQSHHYLFVQSCWRGIHGRVCVAIYHICACIYTAYGYIYIYVYIYIGIERERERETVSLFAYRLLFISCVFPSSCWLLLAAGPSRCAACEWSTALACWSKEGWSSQIIIGNS